MARLLCNEEEEDDKDDDVEENKDNEDDEEDNEGEFFCKNVKIFTSNPIERTIQVNGHLYTSLNHRPDEYCSQNKKSFLCGWIDEYR